MRTLYLEDNMNDARFMSLYFSTTAHTLHHVLDIAEAEELLAHDNDFDLMLIDIMLRQSHEGFSFIQSLRTRGFRQPIVAVTALATAKEHDMCLKSGANYVLQKPFRITVLVNLVQHINAHDK
jgi:DNA-binding response OmpR family regulator